MTPFTMFFVVREIERFLGFLLELELASVRGDSDNKGVVVSGGRDSMFDETPEDIEVRRSGGDCK